VKTVLIADDEPLKVLTLEEHLTQAGYTVLTAVDGNAAMALLKTKPVDALITDVRMPGLDGLQLLDASRQLDPNRPVLVMTGYDEVADAVRAMKAGAIDYLVKPVSGEAIALRLERALAESRLAGENQLLRREVEKLGGRIDPVIVGRGMDATRQALEKAAATNATVLLVGETGTGKELCARYLHRHSARAQGPFVSVPCTALPQTLVESELFGHEKGAFTGATVRRDGYFSAAHSGTLLLDDIDDLPLDVQSRLLQILQSGVINRVGSSRPEHVDVRMVASTKKDLNSLVHKRLFRDDLMYRLSVITIHIPPLRARREDIPLLADFFLKCASARLGRKAKQLTEDTLRLLQAYDWPGNVRQLEHMMESVVVMHAGTEVEPENLPNLSALLPQDALFSLHVDGRESIPLEQTLASFERALLEWALKKADGNQAHAAKILSIPRSTFQYRWSRCMEPRVPAEPIAEPSVPVTSGSRSRIAPVLGVSASGLRNATRSTP
jgi:DNA-binding NtrC family response regulator